MPSSPASKLLVAAHKRYKMPNDPIYAPLQVGASRTTERFGYLTDDTAVHISGKNDTFCELTALYWAWKNNFFDSVDYCGLVHYRRYFAGNEPFGSSKILSDSEIAALMGSCDIILPKKRRYFIETVASHYAHAHYGEDLEALRDTLMELSPEYLPSFDRTMQRRSLHLYNMFVMKSTLFTDYCEWLFPLLFALEKKIDPKERDPYQRRIFGFLAERLFNVWLGHRGLRTLELKTVNIEGENLIKKGLQMVGRMMTGKRRSS